MTNCPGSRWSKLSFGTFFLTSGSSGPGGKLQRLVKMAHAPPTIGQWRAFYAGLCHLIALYRDWQIEAGTFVRSLEKEMDTLFVFLYKEGVEPTNNFAERTIRFTVLWRKRSQGTKTDKGNRRVERILSLRQTCRLQAKSTFAVLVDAPCCMAGFFCRLVGRLARCVAEMRGCNNPNETDCQHGGVL